jgi:hypothetical protein
MRDKLAGLWPFRRVGWIAFPGLQPGLGKPSDLRPETIGPSARYHRTFGPIPSERSQRNRAWFLVLVYKPVLGSWFTVFLLKLG